MTDFTIRDAIAKLVDRRDLTRGRGRRVHGRADDRRRRRRRSSARSSTALRMKGETVDEITGMARVMREKAQPRRDRWAAARHLRHRRRRQRLVQRQHLRRVHRGRCGRARRQARQPRDDVAVRQRRRARGARREDRPHAGAGGGVHRADRRRLHVRAGVSSGDEVRRARCAARSASAPSSTCSVR